MKTVLITGGSGQVGRHLKDIMPDAVYVSSKDYDLLKKEEVVKMIDTIRPRCVVHLAAKVGGIRDNIRLPSEYFYENVMMNTMLLEQCRIKGVSKFISILSTCVYPDKMPDSYYPLKESSLHAGPPTETNFGYGYAKRCMAVHIDSMNRQYGTWYQYLIPTNLYGPYDKYNNRAHFVGDLLRKIKESKDGKITLMGDGSPLRQFMYAGDLAVIIKMCIDNDVRDNFNVAPNENLSIKEIAETAIDVCGKDLEIEWTGNTNGQYRKDVSSARLKAHFPGFKFTSLTDGIKKTWYAINEDNANI